MAEDNQHTGICKSKTGAFAEANLLAVFFGNGINVYGLGIINHLVNFCSGFNCICNITYWMDK